MFATYLTNQAYCKHMGMAEKYLTPTHEAGRDFIMRQISGNVVMLNLLRFRKIADYSETPSIAPSTPITGEEAYQLYVDHSIPHLRRSGSEIIFEGKGGSFLIGPDNEYWDAVILVRQPSVNSFLAFESNQEYMKGIGHRIAALEDSRLLPLIEGNTFNVI